MLINVKSDDLEDAKKYTYLDDFDMIVSPHGGHLVPVAMKHGVHVCWQCGEPFEPEDRKLALVEKLTPGATVPVGVHRKCIAGAPKKFFSVVKGVQTRRAVAEIVKKTAGLVGLGGDK